MCVEGGVVCVGWGGLAHALTLTAQGEENRTGYPRGLWRGRVTEKGVNCQRLLSALKRGLERAEGTVCPLEVVSALVTLSGIA